MFLRPSKFRHVFGCPFKKEACYEGLKATKSAHDTNFCAVNPIFLAVVIESSGGGAFVVLPIEKTGRLEADVPKVCGHKAPITDLKWSPHNDYIIASASDDTTIKIWKIPENGLHENLLVPISDLNSAHHKRVSYIEWHPTALGILLSASADLKCIVWNTTDGVVLSSIEVHPDLIYSISWNNDGSLFATTCKDKKIRVICPRSGTVLVEGIGHLGNKSSRIVFLKGKQLFTTGFSRTSDRQHALWDYTNLSKPLCMEEVDSSCGSIFPHYDPDLNIIYLAGKGDGNIRYVEIIDQHPYIYFLNQFQSSIPQRGLGMMPKRGLDMKRCEIARFFKLHSSKDVCEPISMIVPRKSDNFQPDIYPPTQSLEPSMTAEEWFSGINRPPNYIYLQNLSKDANNKLSTIECEPTKPVTNHHSQQMSTIQQQQNLQHHHQQQQQHVTQYKIQIQQQVIEDGIQNIHRHSQDIDHLQHVNSTLQHGQQFSQTTTPTIFNEHHVYSSDNHLNELINYSDENNKQDQKPCSTIYENNSHQQNNEPVNINQRLVGNFIKKPVERSNTFAATTNHNDPNNFYHSSITKLTNGSAPGRKSRPMRRRRKSSINDGVSDSDEDTRKNSCNRKDHLERFDNDHVTEDNIQCPIGVNNVGEDCQQMNQTAVSDTSGTIFDKVTENKMDVVVDEERKITFKSYNRNIKSPNKQTTPTPTFVSNATTGCSVVTTTCSDNKSNNHTGSLSAELKDITNININDKINTFNSLHENNSNSNNNNKYSSCSSEIEALKSFDFIADMHDSNNNVIGTTSLNSNDNVDNHAEHLEPVIVQNVVLLSSDENNSNNNNNMDAITTNNNNDKYNSRQKLDCISVDAPDDGLVLPSSLRASMISRQPRFIKNSQTAIKSHHHHHHQGSTKDPEIMGLIRVGSVREKSRNYNSIRNRDFFSKPVSESKSVSNLFDNDSLVCSNISLDGDKNHAKSQDNLFDIDDDDQAEKGEMARVNNHHQQQHHSIDVQCGVHVNTIAQMFDKNAQNNQNVETSSENHAIKNIHSVNHNNSPPLLSDSSVTDGSVDVPINKTNGNKISTSPSTTFNFTKDRRLKNSNVTQQFNKPSLTTSVRRTNSLMCKGISFQNNSEAPINNNNNKDNNKKDNSNNSKMNQETTALFSPTSRSPKKFPGKSLSDFNNNKSINSNMNNNSNMSNDNNNNNINSNVNPHNNINNKSPSNGKTVNKDNIYKWPSQKSPTKVDSNQNNKDLSSVVERRVSTNSSSSNSMRRSEGSFNNKDDVANKKTGSGSSGGNRMSLNNGNILASTNNNNNTKTRKSDWCTPTSTNISMSHVELLEGYHRQQQEISNLKSLLEQRDIKIKKLEDEIQKNKIMKC